MKSLIWTSALALAAVCATAGQAAAQEAQTAIEEQPRTEEIIVTAQKREQALRDVPIAITAFSGDFLSEQGVSKFDELSQLTPGFLVQEQSANNTSFVVRGITSDTGDSFFEPRVAVFFDGVSASRNRGSYIELFDLERVEVVKGPQATLFGRSALIGGVSVITKRADLEDFEAFGEFEFGNNGQLRYAAAVNLPIVPGKLAVRAAGTHRERDGFNANLAGGPDLGGVNVDAVRVAVAFRPIDSLRFDLNLGTHGDDGTGTSFKSGTIPPPGGDTSPFSAAALNTFTATGAAPFEGGAPLGLDRRVNYITLNAEWDLSPALTLASTSGYRDFDSVEVFDPDGSFVPILLFAEDAAGIQYSQDLRLLFDTGGPISGFVGAAYFREDNRTRVPGQFDERTTLALLTGQLFGPTAALGPVSPATLPLLQSPTVTSGFLAGLLAGSGVPLTGINTLAIANNLQGAFVEESTNFGETTALDLYGDVTFRVTPKLEFSAGIRYTTEDKTAGIGNIVPSGRSVLGGVIGAATTFNPLNPAPSLGLLAALQAPNAAFIPPSASFPVPILGLQAQPAPNTFLEQTFSGLTWRAVAKYDPFEDFSIFASYARGRRPEVIDPSPPAAPGDPVSFEIVPEETVDSFELGFRSRSLGGQLSVDGSFFYYDYRDFATTVLVGTEFDTINAGDASAVGVELAGRWAPVDFVDVFATYGYNRARFGTGARDGNVFRLSPDHKLSVGAELRHKLETFGVFFLRPTYNWQSEVFFDDDNDRSDLQISTLSPFFNDTIVNEVQGSYGLFNIRGGFKHKSGKWALEGFVENALNTEFLIDAGNVGDLFGIPTFIRGPARLFGLRASASY